MLRIPVRSAPRSSGFGLGQLLSGLGQIVSSPVGFTGMLAAAGFYLNERAKRQKRHIARATPKEQRQYEHIKASALAAGHSMRRAKQIAAATVRTAQKRKRRSR